MSEWALAHPYLTCFLGLAALFVAFFVVDVIGTFANNALNVANNNLKIKAFEAEAKAKK